MDITLADEKAFHLVPQFSLEVARDRVEQKKTNLVAGTVGALLSRPKPEEITLLAVENRLEPFWLVSITSHTAYDRNRVYTVPVAGSEVQSVTVLGQEVPVESSGKAAPGKAAGSFSLSGVEHCVEEHRASQTFDGLTGEKVDLSRYLAFPKTEIASLEQFAPPGTLIVPPQARATAVVRPVMAEVIKPVQALVIHEERVDVEAIELNFRPVYALEYEWSVKAKRTVIEFDGLTGDMRAGGKKLQDQFKSIVTRDLLFDVTADAIGLIVPGGSIAVKLVKAVVDRGKK